MPIDIEKLLTDALGEVKRSREKDELEQRFTKLEGRNISVSDVMTALESASDDELDALRGTVLGGMAGRVAEDREDGNGDSGGGGDPPKPKPKPKPRTRPGRKSGNAYDWWVDDDGNVTRLDVARIYSGDDEPDEVEIRAAEDDNGDGGGGGDGT